MGTVFRKYAVAKRKDKKALHIRCRVVAAIFRENTGMLSCK